MVSKEIVGMQSDQGLEPRHDPAFNDPILDDGDTLKMKRVFSPRIDTEYRRGRASNPFPLQ
jgi:hypothetical protein